MASLRIAKTFYMANFKLIKDLIQPAKTKIVLLVMDGVGGLPRASDDKTELEAAHTPNLDQMAREGCLGQHYPVAMGITSGSGPGHLGLFGYDPVYYEIGRGVLEAVGIGMPMRPTDVFARGNFCTLDAEGLISDRRAGRIPTEECIKRVNKIKSANIRVADDIEILLEPVQDYRFVVGLRGSGLNAALRETDPQRTGVRPLSVVAELPAADRSAELFNTWIAKATEVITDDAPANGLTLRGFASDPALPKYEDVYGLKAGAIAIYPMYRGVANLVGMEVVEHHAYTVAEEFDAAAVVWKDYDFLFIHVKYTDSRGEDGNFEAKKAVIEEVDAALPRLLALKPDVIVVTGDHSTPSQLKAHSWHPVPLLMWAPGMVRPDRSIEFGERSCARGGLGTFQAADIMPLALAHAGRLAKYGA